MKHSIKTLMVLVAIVLATMLLAACGGKSVAEVKVNMTDFAFAPTEWTVSAGQSVNISLTNAGTVEHEWVILKKGTVVTNPFDEDDEDKVFWEIEAGNGETNTA